MLFLYFAYNIQGDYMSIKIFIDQGHNPSGANTGATGNSLNEAFVTYEVGIFLKRLLVNNGNFSVMLSRNLQTEVLGSSNSESLFERVRMANEWGADYFLSLHTNAVSNPMANGTEIFTYRLYGPAYNMASDILNSIVTRLDMRNRGVKQGSNLYVLRRTKMPALLIELGFITNPQDAYKLKNNSFGFANAIYLGMLDYFGL